MSFILDALKKSENERQRQVGPSLADVQVSRRSSDKPWWAVAVAALLIVNLGVLLVVLTRNGDAKPTAPDVAREEASVAPANAPAPVDVQKYGGTPIPTESDARMSEPYARSGSAVRSLADEAGSQDFYEPDASSSQGAAMVPEGPPIVRPIEAPSVSPSPSAMVIGPDEAASREVLPTLNDVTASGTTLPELHLDIHVHSANVAERFIFVNMRKYSEGQSLKEGPVVERITTDGVILNHHGLRFLLPRQ
jgi:general secretion pathway protein B